LEPREPWRAARAGARRVGSRPEYARVGRGCQLRVVLGETPDDLGAIGGVERRRGEQRLERLDLRHEQRGAARLQCGPAQALAQLVDGGVGRRAAVARTGAASPREHYERPRRALRAPGSVAESRLSKEEAAIAVDDRSRRRIIFTELSVHRRARRSIRCSRRHGVARELGSRRVLASARSRRAPPLAERALGALAARSPQASTASVERRLRGASPAYPLPP